MRGYTRHVPYHFDMAHILVNMRLYQVLQMDNIQIDPALITTLVEIWRSETYVFYMSMREITVISQDVVVLWGLPISGDLMTGLGLEYGVRENVRLFNGQYNLQE
jgi:Plant mobile domain